jgi:hypothetical protein
MTSGWRGGEQYFAHCRFGNTEKIRRVCGRFQKTGVGEPAKMQLTK